MDVAYISLLERYLVSAILDEIAATGRYKKHSAFAREAFGDEVANYNSKWSRIRRGATNISFSDIIRVGIVLQMEPALLVAQASADMRRGKPLKDTDEIESD